MAAAAMKAVQWSHRYTGTAIVLSSGLNGYSSVMGCSSEHLTAQVAAGAIGAVIPVLVWMLCQVVSWTYRAGWRRLALATGMVAGCVLALSVCHVAAAIGQLTGSGVLLSLLLAVGIDVGLGASEATAVLVSSVE